MIVEVLEHDLEQKWINAAKQHKHVGIDIETSGLDKEKATIATVQVNVPTFGTAIVRNLDKPYLLMHLLENASVRKIFHYAHFDLTFLMRDYKVMPQWIGDTKVAAKILDPKKDRYYDPNKEKYSHSLAALVWYYKSIRLDKTEATSDWFGELSQSQIEYAVKDTLYLVDILSYMEEEAQRKGTFFLLAGAHAFIPTSIQLQLKGIQDPFGY